MARQGLSLADVGLWELNEAFAAQVLACLAAGEDETFCRDVLNLDGAAGRIERDRLNVDGGAIGLGHPVGASGNRIVLHLVTQCAGSASSRASPPNALAADRAAP